MYVHLCQKESPVIILIRFFFPILSSRKPGSEAPGGQNQKTELKGYPDYRPVGAKANQVRIAGKSYPVVTAQKADGDLELNPGHLSSWNRPLCRSGRSGLLREQEGTRRAAPVAFHGTIVPESVGPVVNTLTLFDRREGKEEWGEDGKWLALV